MIAIGLCWSGDSLQLTPTDDVTWGVWTSNTPIPNKVLSRLRKGPYCSTLPYSDHRTSAKIWCARKVPVSAKHLLSMQEDVGIQYRSDTRRAEATCMPIRGGGKGEEEEGQGPPGDSSLSGSWEPGGRGEEREGEERR